MRVGLGGGRCAASPPWGRQRGGPGTSAIGGGALFGTKRWKGLVVLVALAAAACSSAAASERGPRSAAVASGDGATGAAHLAAPLQAIQDPAPSPPDPR